MTAAFHLPSTEWICPGAAREHRAQRPPQEAPDLGYHTAWSTGHRHRHRHL